MSIQFYYTFQDNPTRFFTDPRIIYLTPLIFIPKLPYPIHISFKSDPNLTIIYPILNMPILITHLICQLNWYYLSSPSSINPIAHSTH